MDRDTAKKKIEGFADKAGWRDTKVNVTVKDHPHFKGTALYDVAVTGIFKRNRIEASINATKLHELVEKARRHFLPG